MRIATTSVLVASLGLACSSSEAGHADAAAGDLAAPPSASHVRPKAEGEKPLTIAVVRMRDTELRIVSGNGGPRFSVVESTGRVLARNLDQAELSRQHPEIYRVYRRARATGPVIDARLDAQHHDRIDEPVPAPSFDPARP